MITNGAENANEQATLAAAASKRPRTSITTSKLLLIGGIIAGPIYLLVGLIQAFTRPGFDLTRHDLSLLSNGSLGWIHITNLIVSGLLVMGAAIGLRQAMHPGRGRNWGSVLIGIYGLGLIGAGIFVADPVAGFPIGTPADVDKISWHGLLHFICGGIGFIALIAGCFVFARRFAAHRQRGWQVFSILTGVIFFAGFVGIASGSGSSWTILGFWIAVVLAWAWISALSARLLGGVRL